MRLSFQDVKFSLLVLSFSCIISEIDFLRCPTNLTSLLNRQEEKKHFSFKLLTLFIFGFVVVFAVVVLCFVLFYIDL